MKLCIVIAPCRAEETAWRISIRLISSDFASVSKVSRKRSKEMNSIKKTEFYELKDFLILWSSQSISQLGIVLLHLH